MSEQLDFVHGAECIPSPHWDERPEKCDISLLVIHNISLPPGEFGGKGIEQLFCGTLDPSEHPFYQQIAGLKVSAHCVIRRDGKVEQYVPFSARAWHAGVSSFQGQGRCNDFSVGIELEGTDTQPYTEHQYASLVKVCQELIEAYPKISLGRIVGHNDIAPGRKTDPGPFFDWCRLRQQLKF
ncbi:1,6-anhydro-N-acetylmuramyl-L-alanine amidase AmpD [Alteromonas aestuariivivens]|uniref:1,6-anhydro-N-acetylmuramyl-L-alanine amidase AmpD n=1 Tax=Alteromonas aestuariivivens TaxID=1938339 RepID=A0A3D8ME27_9ALTE|nr:1,6-anhydro-N-acetylmuramyl-L-alanine amidase AmpD [Alteromonas aestuariivivens]RDV29085.1 1,6-anhydro-N-acetylmuramyl-L-alanine amidase AmpD [Alteromonas aestuariivivens]